MAKIFYESDANPSSLQAKTVAIIGYGNQGRAHGLNLADSGVTVVVGARDGGKAQAAAIADGFKPLSIREAAAKADILAIMLPDEHVPSVYSPEIEPVLNGGLNNGKSTTKTLVFAHGFVVANKTINLPGHCDIVLVAPTGPGRQVRSLYKEGRGLPALLAVEQDISGKAQETALAYAHGIGCTRAGVIKTTFAEETTTDLFCEQAVLCGGVPELIKASFQTLIERGYQPELAYISCLKEVKLIADLLFTHGIDGMREAISNTAKYGSAVAGPSLVNSFTQRKLGELLTNIEKGSFARNFMEEAQAGCPVTRQFTVSEAKSRLARTGHDLKEVLHF